MLRRMERDRYLLLFEEQYLSRFVDQKFDILDTIHQVVNSSGLAATLSIGIGKDGGSFQELMQYANLSIEMALSRGETRRSSATSSPLSFMEATPPRRRSAQR